MTTIHLVRHAAVEATFAGLCFGQRVDPPIAPPPEPDVARLRNALPPGSTVVSSPSRRARQTAALLALPFEIDDRWSERDFGTWEGRRWAECWADVPPAHLESADAYVAFTPGGAEPQADVLSRVGAALDDATHSTTNVMVITHAGPIRAALTIAGLTHAEAFAMELTNLSATSLHFTAYGWRPGASR